MSNRFLHPFLFTVFPVLSLFVHNLLPLSAGSVLVLPIAICLALAFVIFYLLKTILKNGYKAAIITTLLSLFFFSYGHAYEFLINSSVEYASLNPYVRRLLPLVAGFAVVAGLSVWVLRTRANLKPVTGFLNVVAIIAVAQPVVTLLLEEVKVYNLNKKYQEETAANTIKSDNSKVHPDIYYIMMDSYGRADVLKELYNYDNTPFINYLRTKGFYVADCSQSNYPYTLLSQSSTLNMQYIIGEQAVKKYDEKKDLSLALFNNEVFKYVRQLGYRTVAFDAAIFDHVQVTNTDVFYRTPTLSGFAFHNFHYQLISVTPIRILLNWLENDESKYNELHRKKILHGFDKLKEAHKLRSPVFVYAHFLAPHSPHVFDANGNHLEPKVRVINYTDITDTLARKEYSKTYADELHYINKLLMESIDSILTNSKTEPVIILQSDHGPDANVDVNNMERSNVKERLGNLFALRMPAGKEAPCYPTVTPVNTFRLVFNSCFNANFPLLPDKSYYCTYDKVFDLTEVKNFCGDADSINAAAKE